ncbi:MAG: hypothetical protein H7Y38_14745 [Armatimonadetes bacterium]|nr:hypothetical protein [Armatimonadota bacterium]
MRPKPRPVPLWQRRLWYRGRHYLNPFAVLRDSFFRSLARDGGDTFDGIAICSFALDDTEETEERFVNYVREALALIRTHDPVRYRRVKRHLHSVVNQSCETNAQVNLWANQCQIDFNRWSLADNGATHPWYIAFVAKLIVHEATHACIHDHCIPQLGQNRVRVERICISEANDFLTKLPDEMYDFVAGFRNPMTDAQIAACYETEAVSRAAFRHRVWKQLREAFGSLAR